MKRIRKITGVMYHDPGHAWLRVKRELVVHLGLENQISRYSYQRRGYVYLEEDFDLVQLLDAAKLAGIDLGKIEHRSSNRCSKIRNYEFYKPRSAQCFRVMSYNRGQK
jgi:hypothetical protein